MSNLRLRWRRFWSRRSRTRIALFCTLLVITLLAIIWLVLPASWRHEVQAGIQLASSWVSALDTRTLLVALIGLCVVEGMVALLVPSYRKHGYLATMPRLIPSVSVYLDAENQLSEATIRPFMDYLMKYLDGRRADLLFFLDAASQASTAKYKTLNRVGFHLIDVPHDPSGKKVMAEAVDREIAMHAFERALLGPTGQEFIIVSGDGDYVPLIYRLISLGHHVQVWALRPSSAYDVVASYLGVNVIHLSDALTESNNSSDPHSRVSEPMAPKEGQQGKKKPQRKRIVATKFMPQMYQTIPVSVSSAGEGKLYFAILETLEAYDWSTNSAQSDRERDILFRSALNNVLYPRLSSVGYGIGSAGDFWVSHLSALHVLEPKPGQDFPRRGGTSAEQAANNLFATARVVVSAVLAAANEAASDVIHMRQVAEQLAVLPFDTSDPAAPLLHLIRFSSGTKQWAHARYFVRCARAVGLLKFDDVPNRIDEINRPSSPDALAEEATGGDHGAESHPSDN